MVSAASGPSNPRQENTRRVVTVPLPPRSCAHLQSLDSRISSGALPTNLDQSSRTARTPDTSANPEETTQAPGGGQDPPTDVDDEDGDELFLGRRALAVLDGMAVCEVAWHEGGSLPETIYACLYLHYQTFSAILEELGWKVPPIPPGGVPASIDLGIGRGWLP